MKAIQYMRQIESINARIDVLCEERIRLLALATKTTSTLGDEKVNSTSNPHKMERCIVHMADIDKEIDRYIEQKREALNIINASCDKDCIEVLYKRYFINLSWKTIAVQMKLSYKWVSGGLHSRALKQLQNALNEIYTSD